jgi:hypothetical protein
MVLIRRAFRIKAPLALGEGTSFMGVKEQPQTAIFPLPRSLFLAKRDESSLAFGAIPAAHFGEERPQ